MISLLKSLNDEKVLQVGSSGAFRLAFPLKGVVRLMDDKGNTLGLVIDKDTLDEISEDMEASNPAFLASLEVSRASGRISSKEIERRLGIK